MNKTGKVLLMSSMLVLAFGPGCGSDDPSGGANGASVKISAAAMGSLPSKAMANTSFSVSTALDRPEEFGDKPFAGFFRRECYMPRGDGANGYDSHCPSNIDPATDWAGSKQYKYSGTTLLGNIYHAAMYAGQNATECDGSTGTVGETSFVAAASGGSPVKYLFDLYNKYTCLKNSAESGTTVKSVGLSGEQYSLTTRYHMNEQTDFFQVYSSFDSDLNAKIVAYNFAGVATMASRVILIFNSETHKYVVKYIAPTGINLLSAGVGGVDVSTGSDRVGNYWVKYGDSDGVSNVNSLCVNNVGSELESDSTPCTGIPGVSGTMDVAAVKAYLGLTDAQATALAPLLTKLSSNALLVAPTDTPTTVHSALNDTEKNFPATVNLL